MSQWIAGISRGHNASVCLLKDGEVVFAVEEERLSRQKHDGGPYACMVKILEYTDKLDYLIIAHTQPDKSHVEFSGGDVYSGLARKLHLIDDNNNQVWHMDRWHHKMHAACAFYRSGFESAVALVVDGAGTYIPMEINGEQEMTWELESIIDCSYPANFKTLYKHLGGRGPWNSTLQPEFTAERENEEGTYEACIDDSAGIVKAYEAVTRYCGWMPIEAGKTMGLFPYGEPCDKFPDIYNDGGGGKWKTADRNLIIPTYPNGAVVNEGRWEYLNDPDPIEATHDLTRLENRRNMAYAIQTESQQMVLELIRKSVEMSGNKNVVLSGGYGLNCVANYWYLGQLKDEGINLYVEPISNDAGTSMGAALFAHHMITKEEKVRGYADSLFLGPKYKYTDEEVENIAKKYNGTTKKIYSEDAVKLILKGNIVTLFQGSCENGPRALGNRSVLFDPRTEDGKAYVNSVKRREYFRPFAGTILHEYADEWFDMRGLEESPHMMYAMYCNEGYKEKIPAIVHVDGTCRIQTLKKEQNPVFYEMIEEFNKQTAIPILFNTSFNLAGEPLVESLDDAIKALNTSRLEYLYCPENDLLVEVLNEKS